MRVELVSDFMPKKNGNPRQSWAGRENVVIFGVLALLLLAVIWGAALHVIRLERAAAEESAINSSAELLETYKAQMVRNLGAIDQTLKIVKFAFEFQNNQFSLPELREKDLLPSSVVFDVHIADQNGNIVASSSAKNGAQNPPNIAGQTYFQTHRQFDTGKPWIGMSTQNQNTQQWELQFSRRLNTVDGSFAGAVVLTVDPAYFTSGYEISRLGEHGVLGLLAQHGEILVLRGGDHVSSGGTPIAFKSDDLTNAQGRLQRSSWDDVPRYTAVQAVPGYPLIAIVGLDQEEQFKEYSAHRRAYLWEAALSSVMVALVIAVLSRLSSQLSKSRRRMRKIQETYHAASEASVDAFYLLQTVSNKDGQIVDFLFGDINRRGEALVGIKKGDLLGKRLTEIFPDIHTDNILGDLIGVAQDGVIHEKEWHNSHAALRAEWLYRQVVRVEDGVVAILRDISERKRLETKIRFQATHDALTGLANRMLLQDRLHQAIAQAARTSKSVWVVFIDLDRFKLINDSLGHKAGDIFLTAISERLQTIVRDSDTVARLGGDEFVLVLPEFGDHKLSANTLKRIMQVVSQAIPIGEKEFTLNCSLGVAVYPNDGNNSTQLIERADMAMYRAKETGRNNFQFFTEEMNEKLLERLMLEEAMRKAVERGEFVLYYQPQVDFRTGRVVGAEALIRWKHPELGLVPPAKFIPLAEETGLIVPIGQWVIRAACEQNMAWERAGYGALRIAVNLSARQFAQPNLALSIASTLTKAGLEPERLEIELTEGLVMTDVENAIEILRDLKALGLQLSIDDFGTGYSSLSYLKRFPIDILKIDQSFVSDIENSPDDATIVLSIISLAHNLRMRVIAEGVETQKQLEYLREHGCDEMQGYYFSRPLPAEEFGELIRSGKGLPFEADAFASRRQS